MSQVASLVEKRIDRVLDISEEETNAAKASAAQRRGMCAHACVYMCVGWGVGVGV